MSKQAPNNQREPKGNAMNVRKVPKPSFRVSPPKGDGKTMRKGR